MQVLVCGYPECDDECFCCWLSAVGWQVCVLEGKAYSELEPGTETEEDLDACMLLTNSQGKELLAPGKGAEQADNKKILLKLQDGEVGRGRCGLSVSG